MSSIRYLCLREAYHNFFPLRKALLTRTSHLDQPNSAQQINHSQELQIYQNHRHGELRLLLLGPGHRNADKAENSSLKRPLGQVDLKKIMATGPNALWGLGGLQGGRGFWLNSRLYAHPGNLFDIQTGV